MEANPIRDSEAWLADLLKKNEMLGAMLTMLLGCTNS
jgi:hypothetical protein